MKNNIRMIIDNVHDTSTLTATSNALPIDFTKRSGRSYVWRSTDTSTQVIDAQLSAGTYINALVLYRHNLTATATVRIELIAGDVIAYDSGDTSVGELIPIGTWRAGIDPWGASYNDSMPVQLKTFWLETVAVTAYRITINDSANPDGYIQIGRIVSGLSFSPVYNPQYGSTLEWIETVEHQRTEGGSLRSIGEGLYRRLSIDLSLLLDVDRSKLTSELVKKGRSSDVFVSLYPESGGSKELEHQFLSRRDSDFSPSHIHPQFWSSELVFVEV